jgi:hypothetical protein
MRPNNHLLKPGVPQSLSTGDPLNGVLLQQLLDEMPSLRRHECKLGLLELHFLMLNLIDQIVQTKCYHKPVTNLR